MKKSMYVIAFTILFLTACKNEKKQNESNEMHMEEMNMPQHNEEKAMMGNSSEDASKAASIQNNSSTTEIIDSYLQIKNALVEDNKAGAAKGGKMMLTAFSNFDMTKLTEAQHKEYMDIIEDAKEQAEHISDSPIDHQREHFENLSVDINDLIELLGTDKTLYQSHCPMAGDGKGAIWLSEFKEIKNPFLGSKMLTCGSVQKIIN
jgi:hypothetical protein